MPVTRPNNNVFIFVESSTKRPLLDIERFVNGITQHATITKTNINFINTNDGRLLSLSGSNQAQAIQGFDQAKANSENLILYSMSLQHLQLKAGAHRATKININLQAQTGLLQIQGLPEGEGKEIITLAQNIFNKSPGKHTHPSAAEISTARKRLTEVENLAEQVNRTRQKIDEARVYITAFEPEVRTLQADTARRRERIAASEKSALDSAASVKRLEDEIKASRDDAMKALAEIEAKNSLASDAKKAATTLNAALAKIKAERKEKLNRAILNIESEFRNFLAKGEDLEKKAQELLSAANASRLNEAFETASMKGYWLMVALLVSIVSITVGVCCWIVWVTWTLTNSGTFGIDGLLIRYAGATPALLLDWFLIREFTSLRKERQRYSFKSAVLLSLPEFKHLVKDENGGVSDFASRVAHEVYKSPFEQEERLSSMQIRSLTRILRQVAKYGAKVAEPASKELLKVAVDAVQNAAKDSSKSGDSTTAPTQVDSRT